LLILATEAGANGDATKQKGYLDQLVAAYPRDERAQFNIGGYYFGQQDFAAAIEHYKKATELAPSYSPAYNILGYAYRQKGDFKSAIVHLQKATELQPADATAWNNLGVVKSRADDKDGAIAAFKKALSINPNDAETHFNLGVVYRRQRDTENALAEDETAVKLNPRLAKAYYDLGVLYSQERRTADAAAAFRKYLETGTGEDASSRKDAEERLKSLESAGPGAGSKPSGAVKPARSR